MNYTEREERAITISAIADDYVDLIEGRGMTHEEAVKDLRHVAACCNTPPGWLREGIEDGLIFVNE